MTRRSWSLVLVALLLVSTIGMPLMGAGTVSAQELPDRTEEVTADDLTKSEVLTLVEYHPSDLTQAERDAVMMWIGNNALDFSDEELQGQVIRWQEETIQYDIGNGEEDTWEERDPDEQLYSLASDSESSNSEASDSQSVDELVESLDRPAVVDLIETDPGEVSETQYRAVIIWTEENAFNTSDELSERFDEWTSSLSEQHGVSPSEIREQYSAETESDSESESGSESDIDASEIQEQDEPEPLPEEELIEADIVFLNELRLQELDHEDGMAKFKLQNPTTDVQRVVLNPSGTDEQALIRLDPGETREVNIQMEGTLSWSLSVSTGITTEQFDEVAESGDGTTDRLQYTIEHDILTINHAPDVGHPIVGIGSGGVMIFLMLFATFMFDNRVSRMAIPVNAPAQQIFDKRKDFTPEQSTGEKFLQFVSGWISGWGLVVINIVVLILGGLAFFAASPISNPYLAGMTVYAMYGQFLFCIPSGGVGFWIARKRFKELSDVSPANGDNHLWLLSPQRFANMTVMREVVDPETGERTVFEVPKDWLYEINENSPRDAYEVENYDAVNNVAWVSWSGEVAQIKPSDLRRHQRLVPWIQDTASYVFDQLSILRDFYVEDVRQEAEYLNARQTAVIEEEVMDGMGSTRERVKGRMKERGNGDILEGNEASLMDEASESVDNYDPREQQEQHEVGKRVDAGDSQ